MTPHRIHAAAALALAAALMSLAGCDGVGPNAAAAEPKAAATESGEAIATQALNGYVKAANLLIGSNGLAAVRGSYEDLRIAQTSPLADLSFNPGWLGEAAQELKKARALSARAHGPRDPSAEALDLRADFLIATLDDLAPRLTALEPYYKAKAYREDGLARGRAEHAAITAGFRASETAEIAFRDAMQTRLSAREQDRLVRLKAGGDLLGYDTVLAMVQAKQLMRDVDAAAGAKGARAFDSADATARALEQTLGAARTELAGEIARRPANASARLDDRAYDTQGLVDELTEVVGRYRDLKAKRTDYEARFLVQHYNQAVERANRMRTPG